MIPELSVGIDYHKDSLQVCVIEANGAVRSNKRIKNDIAELIHTVGAEQKGVVVAAEACCGTAALLDELHSKTQWAVKLCHPGYAQRMRNNPDKTDRSDGELIADLTRIGYLPEVWLAPHELRDLRALVRYRALRMNERRSAKLRVRAVLRNNRIVSPAEYGLWTNRGRIWLNSITELCEHSQWILKRYLAEIDRLKQEIAEATGRMSAYASEDSLCRKLLEQRGIGTITACVMRAEIGTFARFKNGKQLAKYCGLSPCNRSSGNLVADAGLIRAGNPLLKACIIQIAWCLLRCDEHWQNFGKALLEKGKSKGVVVCAVANRWLRRLYHEVKTF